MKPPERISAKYAEAFTSYLDTDQKIEGIPKFKHSIGSTYIKLLKAISDSETKDIGKLCEGNMNEAFSEGLARLHRHTEAIQLLNFDSQASIDDITDN